MDDRYIFLNFLLICCFLLIILSAIFFIDEVDIVNIFVLVVLSFLGCFFFYKGSFFQKFLFVLSVLFLLAFISIVNVWFFESYSPYVIVLNWCFIWLISKKSSNFDYIIAKNGMFSIFVVFYLIFNCILVLPADVLDIIINEPSEINLFSIPLVISLILSIFFVITTLVNYSGYNLEND